MNTLAIVIIICLAVLSTPLSLKKLIDRQKYTSSSLKDMLQEAGHADDEQKPEAGYADDAPAQEDQANRTGEENKENPGNHWKVWDDEDED